MNNKKEELLKLSESCTYTLPNNYIILAIKILHNSGIRNLSEYQIHVFLKENSLYDVYSNEFDNPSIKNVKYMFSQNPYIELIINHTQKNDITNFFNWLNKIELIDATIKESILSRLMFTDEEEIATSLKNILAQEGFSAAFNRAKSYQIVSSMPMLTLATLLHKNSDYENAFKAYSEVSPRSDDDYREACYQIATLIMSNKLSKTYQNDYERAKEIFRYFWQAGDYKDTFDLMEKNFNYLCHGSNAVSQSNFGFKSLFDSSGLNTYYLTANALKQKQNTIDALNQENKALREKIASLEKNQASTTTKSGPNFF